MAGIIGSMRAFCRRDYKTEIDLSELDIPKIEHIPFKAGRIYDCYIIDGVESRDDYSVDGEDGVSVVFCGDVFDKYFIVGKSAIRNHKLEMIGI